MSKSNWVRPSEHAIWSSMRQRCDNPNNQAYHRYGGRGITVCERWQTFSNFVEDMGPRPPGLQLDRIDNDKGYSPDNCRWATPMENSHNTATNRRLTLDGVTKTLAEWGRDTGLSQPVITHRLKAGWQLDKALTAPRFKGLFITFNGKAQSAEDWSRELGIKKHTILYRVRNGWPVERVLDRTKYQGGNGRAATMHRVATPKGDPVPGSGK